MKLESLKSEMFEKELSLTSMAKITGGYTLTGCSGSSTAYDTPESDCSDKDTDQPQELAYA